MKIRPNIAYLCKTEELAKQFLNQAKAEGRKWVDGEPISQNNNWHSKNTCYIYCPDERGISYSDKKYFLSEGIQIIEYDPNTKPIVNENFKPYLAVIPPMSHIHCGYIGEKADFADLNGKELSVGDVIEMEGIDTPYKGETLIVHNNKNGFFVMGWAGGKFKNGICKEIGIKIRKKKSYKDLEDGEMVDILEVILTPREKKERGL